MVASGGCGSSGNESASLRPIERPDLERTLRALTQNGYSGAVALVQTDAGIWRGASGYADLNARRRAEVGDRFGIGSTTKTFVATVVVQLVGEGRLSLQDRVDKWLPGLLREGRRITVRELLNHTSGLPQGFSPTLSPGDAAQRLLFRPGTAHSYSNVNYVVLGLIVEKVTGRRLNQVVRDRIFRPLQLEDTSYGRAALRPHSDRMPAWLGSPDDSTDPVSGAGGIVSTVEDLERFFHALLGGELLRPDLLSEMTRTVRAGEDFRAGLGLFRFQLPCGVAWGHGGVYSAYSTMALGTRDGSSIVVVAENAFDFASVQDLAEEMYCS